MKAGLVIGFSVTVHNIILSKLHPTIISQKSPRNHSRSPWGVLVVDIFARSRHLRRRTVFVEAGNFRRILAVVEFEFVLTGTVTPSSHHASLP